MSGETPFGRKEWARVARIPLQTLYDRAPRRPRLRLLRRRPRDRGAVGGGAPAARSTTPAPAATAGRSSAGRPHPAVAPRRADRVRDPDRRPLRLLDLELSGREQ